MGSGEQQRASLCCRVVSENNCKVPASDLTIYVCSHHCVLRCMGCTIGAKARGEVKKERGGEGLIHTGAGDFLLQEVRNQRILSCGLYLTYVKPPRSPKWQNRVRRKSQETIRDCR